MRKRWFVAAIATAIMLGAFAYLTTAPPPAAGGPDPVTAAMRWLNGHGLTDLTFTEAEYLANVVVFVPVGIAAFALLPRRFRWWALTAGPALSIVIEVGQYLFFPLRTASIDDIVANSIGATCGVLVAAGLSALKAQLSRVRTR